MEKVLVTGGAGFIGSNLASRLVQEGYCVDVVDDLSSGHAVFIPKGNTGKDVDIYYCDYTNETVLHKIHQQRYQTIFHLAATPRVSYSVEHPYETTKNNISKVVQLLEAAKGNVGRFINTSSSSVYGLASLLPTPEYSEHKPMSPYALQKATVETFCKMFGDLYGLDTVSIRPFNVFGPNQLGKSAYSTAISAWLYAAKHNKPLRSDGTGEQSKDMTYVDNVVDVFVRCAKHKDRFNGVTFNAGSEGSVSNNEILKWFKQEFPNCQIENAPARKGDVLVTKADMSLARKILGWKLVVPFCDGLKMTRDWAINSRLF